MANLNPFLSPRGFWPGFSRGNSRQGLVTKTERFWPWKEGEYPQHYKQAKMISYTSYTEKLHALLRRMRGNRLRIPDHQREFVWSLRQQRKLIEAIRRRKPIPSILLRDLGDEDETMTLEDGQQRLRTCLHFQNGDFALEDGRRFTDLSPEEQETIRNYDFIVVKYSGATDEEAREIFNDFQNGKPLTFGERLYSLLHTSPIVGFAVRMLLTPAEGFYERLAPIMGLAGRTPKSRRGADTARAFALCAGVAFGIDHLSRKWDDADAILHRDFDEEQARQRLEAYVRVWERVHAISPVTTATRRNGYWDLGSFGGYIVYSQLKMGTPEGMAMGLPGTMEELTERWAQHIVEVYRDETLLAQVLHRDLSAARSWKEARWANGVRRMFSGDNVEVMEDSEDEDDATE
jgi:hypothetical protein